MLEQETKVKNSEDRLFLLHNYECRQEGNTLLHILNQQALSLTSSGFSLPSFSLLKSFQWLSGAHVFWVTSSESPVSARADNRLRLLSNAPLINYPLTKTENQMRDKGKRHREGGGGGWRLFRLEKKAMRVKKKKV